MASNGKSISEITPVESTVASSDLVLTSHKGSDNKYTSKAVKKEAFEKLIVDGDRDASSRTSNADRILRFIDNTTNHKLGGYVQSTYETSGNNIMNVAARKNVNGADKNAVVRAVVRADGTTYVQTQTDKLEITPDANINGRRVEINGGSPSIEFYPQSGVTNGGFIDFHYAGSTDDRTSRLIEQTNELQLESGDKDIKLLAPSGKKVILQAPTNNAVLVNEPTANTESSLAIATVGWVLKKRYISTVDDQWTKRIDLLDSMLTPDPMHLFVKNTIEPTSIQDGTYDHPFKYLHQCQTKMQTRRFIGNAWCYIHMLSDYSITSSNDQFNDTVKFSHPDMLSNRFIEIIGSNGLTKDQCMSNQQASTKTQITLDNTGISTYYKNALFTICNVQLRNIYIVSQRNGKTATQYISTAGAGGTPLPMSQREDAIYEFSKAQTAFTAITEGSSGRLDLVDCKIEGFRWGICGRGAFGGTNEFKDCTRGITATIGRYSLGGILQMTGYSGVSVVADGAGTSIYINYTATLNVDTCRYIPIGASSGTLHIEPSNSNSNPDTQSRGINIKMWMGDGESTRNVTADLNYAGATDKPSVICQCIKRMIGVDATQMLTSKLQLDDNVTGLKSGSNPINRGDTFGTMRIDLGGGEEKNLAAAKWLGLA